MYHGLFFYGRGTESSYVPPFQCSPEWGRGSGCPSFVKKRGGWVLLATKVVGFKGVNGGKYTNIHHILSICFFFHDFSEVWDDVDSILSN